MNIQRGDKGIGWTDATWNPVTGCKNNCSYCYARKISHRFGRSFEPTFHPERLEEPYELKKPSKIFVCSMGELFGPWVPKEWWQAVLNVVEDNSHHIFQFLTKYPDGYRSVKSWPKNVWLGVTITKNPVFPMRVLAPLWGSDAKVLFISAEPLLELPRRLYLHLDSVDWLIVGAQTNPDKQPAPGSVEELIFEADYSQIPIFMKSNLDYRPLRREFPRGGGDE